MPVIPQTLFGSLVKDALRDRSVSYSIPILAQLVGCSAGYLARVLRNEQEPSWSMAVAVARAIGCSVDELADDNIR